MRRAEIAWLGADGALHEAVREVPDLPLFVEALSAIARGTILSTERGPMAVEDILPGDRVETATDGLQRVVWIGSTHIAQATRVASGQDRLFRVPCDSFGLNRPSPDLLLGPGALIAGRFPGLDGLAGGDRALAPVEAMCDGATVIRVTPASPVQVYHLAFAAHQILRANGVEIASFHPGRDLASRLPREMTGSYLSLFPHLGNTGFGAQRLPRLGPDDLDGYSAA